MAVPKVDRRSWQSRYRSLINPKPKKPRIKRKKPRRPPRSVSSSVNIDLTVNMDDIVTQRYYNAVTGQTISSSTSGSSVLQRHERKIGVRTPNFRQLRKKQLPMNGYHRRVVTATGTPYVSDTVSNTGFGNTITRGNAVGQDTFVPLAYKSVTNTEAEAMLKARSRLAENVNKMSINLGVAFAERKQTASLIANTTYRIAHAAAALKRGHLGDVYGLLGLTRVPSQRELDRLVRTKPDLRVSNYWLELQFGWKPLLQDIHGGAELLAKHVVGNVYLTQAKGSATVRQTKLLKRYPYPFEGWIYSKSRVRYLIDYHLDSYGKAALSATGISNPLTVAWEILPYSFVVDWFLPVGNFLETLYAFDGFEFVRGSQSAIWEGEVAKSFDQRIQGGGESGTVTGRSKFTEFSYDRKSLTDFPAATFPSFRNPLGKGPLWKFLTSAALLRTAFGRHSSDGVRI